VTVNQIDITQLAIDLNNAGDHAQQSLDDIMLTVANGLAGDMQQRAPIKTGNLRGSIRVIVTMRGRLEIGPDVHIAPYAWDVEYGTKPHIIKAKPGKVLRFEAGGKVIYTREVHHPGTRPQPYVQPAVDAFMGRLSQDAVKVGVNAVVKPR
jgi:hypothetical protein